MHYRRTRRQCVSIIFSQVLYTLEGVGVVVFAELWFAFLPERGAVAGGLGIHLVFGQPGNHEGLTSFQEFSSQMAQVDVSICVLFSLAGFEHGCTMFRWELVDIV